MKANKRMACLVLAFLMFLIGFAGCKKKEVEEGSSAAGSSSQVTVSEPGKTPDGPSWKRDTSPITVEWFGAYEWFGRKFDPEKNMADKKILEETGITIKYSGGNQDKLNALISTNSLPDIITIDATAPQRTLLEYSGRVVPLEQLVKKYAPDMKVPQSQRDWYRNEKTKEWYAVIGYYMAPETINEKDGGYLVTQNQNFVRKDIIDQIGMSFDQMQTKEGFITALRKVKEQNIQYKGRPVIPYYAPVNLNYIAEQFGGDWESRDGEYVNIIQTPEYLEAAKFFNQLYNEKLMPDEVFTADLQQRNQRISNGEVFATTDWLSVNTARESLYHADNKALMIYAGQIVGDGGEKPMVSSVSTTGSYANMISSNAKNPERIAQLFSYCTTDEFTLDCRYGTDCYDIIDGAVKIKPEKQAEMDADYNSFYAKYFWDFNSFQRWDAFQKTWPKQTVIPLDKDGENIINKDTRSTIVDARCFLDTVPETGSELAVKQVKIDDFWRTAIAKMVMAPSQEACEKIYKESLQAIEKMGFNELCKYKDERFQKNKLKVGVKFAWTNNQ